MGNNISHEVYLELRKHGAVSIHSSYLYTYLVGMQCYIPSIGCFNVLFNPL